MIYLALQIAAAAYMIAIMSLSTPKSAGEWIIMKATPSVVAIGMWFFLFASFMGWPV